jgi:serine/threonine protein kinase
VDDNGSMELTEDIFDVGVLAFTLLNGITENGPNGGENSASQSM